MLTIEVLRPSITIQKYKKTKKNAGYSLIELTIALSILAVIIVGALVGVQKILRSNAVNNELKALPVTIAAAQRLTNNLATLNGLTSNTFLRLGVWPQDRVVGAGANQTVSNYFGGFQYLNPNSAAVAGYPIEQIFVLTLTNIPTEACSDIISGMDSMALGLYIGQNITSDPAGAVATTVVKNPGDATNAAARGMNLTNLAQICGGAGGQRVRIDMLIGR